MDHVVLADGRRLDVRVSGPSGGPVLLFHHGSPGAATPMRFLERAAHERGLRVVTPARPGCGRSTRQPCRTVVDAVADAEQLLERLGADTCLVAGWSGGGPHALACAARLPQATAVTVLAGLAPYPADGLDWFAGMGADNVEGFTAALEGEDALRVILERDLPEVRSGSVEALVAGMASLLPEVDRVLVTDEFGEDLLRSGHEAVRTGVDGWADDSLAFCRPWGFDLPEISVPTTLWHGSEDLMVPFGHGRWLADRVPGVSAHLLEGEGHVSVVLGRVGEALDELVAAGRRVAG